MKQFYVVSRTANSGESQPISIHYTHEKAQAKVSLLVGRENCEPSCFRIDLVALEG